MSGTIENTAANMAEHCEAELSTLANDIEGKITMRIRLRHFTWAQFALPLSTGGIGLLLATTPHQFPGLDTIGKIFFIFDLVVFVAAIGAITFRFVSHPGAFRASLVHPTEALFVPTVLITMANIIGCSQVYGAQYCGPWFVTAMQVLFWIYVAFGFLAAVIQYLALFNTDPDRLTIQSMTPAWILPIFPITIGGTLASLIAPDQSPTSRMPIVVGGLGFQGLGWMVAFLMYATYIARLMSYGLPAPNLRPGMFISVGPPSFTAVALIGLAAALPTDYGFFSTHPTAIEILHTMALFTAIFLWVFALWFLCITIVAVVMGRRKMKFHLVWWGFVFPNVGFNIATIKIGQQLESAGILWVSSVMSIFLVGLWMVVLGAQIRAVIVSEIMWPGKDEDKICHKDDDEKRGVAYPKR